MPLTWTLFRGALVPEDENDIALGGRSRDQTLRGFILVGDDLRAYSLELVNLDLNGKLHSRRGANLIRDLEWRYDLPMMRTPPPPPVIRDDFPDSAQWTARAFDPFWGVVNKPRAFEETQRICNGYMEKLYN